MVKLEAASSDKITLEPVSASPLPGGSAESIELTFTGLGQTHEKVDGQLVVSGGKAPF